MKPKPFARQLKRVRRICLELPDVMEKISHGEPTFFVKKRVFAMFSNNHHGDGHVGVWLPAPPRWVMRASVSSRSGPDPSLSGALLETPAWTWTSMAIRLSRSIDDAISALPLALALARRDRHLAALWRAGRG